MNAILSLILSLVLAFGGGAMPAVPETAASYTVDSIVLTIGDETVALNPAIVYSAAAGSQQLQASFGIELEEDILVPLAGELTPDGVKFSLGSGRVYSLSAETLNALTGMSEPDAASMAPLKEFGEFAAMIPELYSEAFTNYDANFALSEEMVAHWIELSGATPETFEIDVNGVSVPVTCVEMNLTAQDMMSSLDMLREKGDETMQAYLQKMLDLYSGLFGAEVSSFSEFFSLTLAGAPEEAAAEAAEALELAFPIEITYGSKDGLYYMEEIVNTEMEGIAMDISESTVYQDGVTEMVMSMTMGNEELTISMGGAAVYDLNGSMDLTFDITAEAMDQPVLGFYLSADRAADENGLADTSVALDIEVTQADVNVETGETTMNKTNISIGWISEPYAEEDGSISTDCELTVNATDGAEDFDASLAFVFNRAETAFEDAFTGMEAVELPADTEAEAYQLLSSEVFGPLSDLMVLAMEESVIAAGEMFSELTGSLGITSEEADGYYADSYAGSDDPAILDEEYLLDDPYYDESFDYPEYTYSAHEGVELDLTAAAEIYGRELPAFTVPEGFTLDWMYTSQDYCSVDFTSDARYLSVAFYPAYEGTSLAAMHLNDDGSLTPIDGEIAQVQLNEDGTVLYIDFVHNGTQFSLYADGTPVEEMQQFISCFMG